MKKLFASLALAAAVAPVWAATQTVTLAVPGMTCAACPDHRQESALQGRRREQGRCGLREARGRRHF